MIRSADVDDAPSFHALYRRADPPSALLDQRRELWPPTLDELRELFASQKSEATRDLNAIEDLDGCVRGFCAVRSNAMDGQFGNFVLMFVDPTDVQTKLAKEAADYVADLAFRKRILRKIMTQCFDHDHAFRALLLQTGFTSDGVQRDVFFSRGRWHGLESFTMVNPDRRPVAADLG